MYRRLNETEIATQGILLGHSTRLKSNKKGTRQNNYSPYNQGSSSINKSPRAKVLEGPDWLLNGSESCLNNG